MSKLDDVAKAAGLSKATVSRVINNSDIVSTETKNKVKQAIQSLNLNAQDLKRTRKQTMKIGLVFPLDGDIQNNNFGTNLIIGVEQKIFEKEYMLLFGNSASNVKKELQLVNQMLNDVEGIILLTASTPLNCDHLKLLQNNAIPFVLVDQRIEGIEAHIVRGDNYSGAATLTNHLVSLGHHKIAIVIPSTHSTYIDRMNAYKSVMTQHGIPLVEAYQVIIENLEVFELSAAKSLLSLEPRPTALFVAEPRYLDFFVKAAQELNLHIPEDLSMVVYDESDTQLSNDFKNFFTSIDQPGKLIGSMAAELLFQQLHNPNLAPQEIVLQGTFHQRKSTAALL